MYDDLYDELITFNTTVAVQPENSTSGQGVISSSQNQDTEIREVVVHQRQDMLLDEFLRNEFKINTDPETESE